MRKTTESIGAVHTHTHGVLLAKSKTENGRNVVALSIILIVLLICTCLILASNYGINVNTITRLMSGQPLNMEYEKVENGDSDIEGCEYVKFNAYFENDSDGDGIIDKVKGTCNRIGEEDTLFINLQVLGDGYLKDGSIQINQDNKNFYYYATFANESEYIDGDYNSENEPYQDLKKAIKLKTINSVSNITIPGNVRSGQYNQGITYIPEAVVYGDGNEMCKENSVTLKGTYVKRLENGEIEEIPINVIRNFHVDWYGEAICEVSTANNESKNQADLILDKANGLLNIKFEIEIKDGKYELKRESINIEGTLPKLNKYSPVDIKIIHRDTKKEIPVSYDTNTGKFTANIKSEYINDYYGICFLYIQITYPLDAYKDAEQHIKVPIEAYINCYNNPHEGFKNPYTTNVSKKTFNVKVGGVPLLLGIDVFNSNESLVAIENENKYIISKKTPWKMYQGISGEEDIDETYLTQWRLWTQGDNGNITLKDIDNFFIKTNGKNASMQSASYYVKTTVQIWRPNGNPCFLDENGRVEIYNDETNELLTTFYKKDFDEKIKDQTSSSYNPRINFLTFFKSK